MGNDITISEAGRLGGKAGTGDAKVRGDSEYYSKLAAKRRKHVKRMKTGKIAGNSADRRKSRRIAGRVK